MTVGQRLRQRTGRDRHHVHHRRYGRRHLDAEPADPVHHDRWIVHDDDHLADDGHLDGVGAYDRHGRRRRAHADHRRHRRQQRPAVKTWVNATISITPSATNEVNAPHTFTTTVMKDTGTGTLVPAAGETVDVTLTSSNGACPVPPGPFTGTTDAAGQFAVTFTSAARAR